MKKIICYNRCKWGGGGANGHGGGVQMDMGGGKKGKNPKVLTYKR